MFLKTSAGIAVLTILFLHPQSAQLPNESSDNVKEAESLFGVTAEYVEIYRKSGSSPSKLYGAHIQNHCGKQYVAGKSSSTNPRSTLLFLLDEVQVIKFPNPDYEKKVKKKPKPEKVPVVKKTLAENVEHLRKVYWREVGRLDDMRKVIRHKKNQIARIQRMLADDEKEESSDAMQTKLELLNEELDAHSKNLQKIKMAVETADMNYSIKRRDAVLQGVYSKRMDDIN